MSREGVQKRVVEVSPTVRQRELGMRLRDLRTSQDLTVEEVGEKLLCSATKISRVETAARRPSLRDVRDLCSLYNVSPEETTQLMDLARQAREQGWWTGYDDLKIPHLIGLEQEATAITCFANFFVPALLQTEDYATAIIKSILPKIKPEILRQRVEARMRRQHLLERPSPPRYRALLDEAALLRQFGGPEVMKAQLDKVLQLADDGKVTVQVISFEATHYAAMDSNFVYLEFGDSSLHDIVFVEGAMNHFYHEKPAELEHYAESVEYLRDTALNPRDSVNRIAEIRDRRHGSQ